MNAYQCRLRVPFGVLGILTDQGFLTGIDFLPAGTPELVGQTKLARETCIQLHAYLEESSFTFDLPLHPRGTAYQCRVWQALRHIPPGRTETYGMLAQQLGSAPRAVGQACGNNPIPIIIPCHRVLGAKGLGGFMHHSTGSPLQIKRWLLVHEHAQL